jgi:IS30 family transposase
MSRQPVATMESPARPSIPGRSVTSQKVRRDCRSAPKRRRTRPMPLTLQVVGKIIYLRQNYHFGPQKIAMYLARYRDVTISVSGVWRILKKFELNRLPSSQRYKRADRKWKHYQRQLPGHQIQIDVKFVDALAGSGRRKKFYQFTAIDDCTRLRVLRLYPHCDMRTAIQFYDYTASRMPFTIERVQTDNGS